MTKSTVDNSEKEVDLPIGERVPIPLVFSADAETVEGIRNGTIPSGFYIMPPDTNVKIPE